MTGETNTASGSSTDVAGRPDNLLKFDTNVCEKFDPNITDANSWLHKFISLATYLKWTNEQMCFFFGLHLLKSAYTWFSNLSPNIATNFDQLKEQFILRFSLNGATKWSILPEIYEMKQRHDQPVQDFIQSVQIKAKLIDLPEDQVIGALMKGFLSHIRSDLIRSDITSIADVIKEASTAEQAHKIRGNPSDNILSEERLVKAIQAAMSISHIQTPTEHNQSAKTTEKPYFNGKSQNMQRPSNFYPRQRPNHTGQRTKPNYICTRCNRQGHHYQNQCPHIKSVCHLCSKTGHIQRACPFANQ